MVPHTRDPVAAGDLLGPPFNKEARALHEYGGNYRGREGDPWGAKVLANTKLVRNLPCMIG